MPTTSVSLFECCLNFTKTLRCFIYAHKFCNYCLQIMLWSKTNDFLWIWHHSETQKTDINWLYNNNFVLDPSN